MVTDIVLSCNLVEARVMMRSFFAKLSFTRKIRRGGMEGWKGV